MCQRTKKEIGTTSKLFLLQDVAHCPSLLPFKVFKVEPIHLVTTLYSKQRSDFFFPLHASAHLWVCSRVKVNDIPSYGKDDADRVRRHMCDKWAMQGQVPRCSPLDQKTRTADGGFFNAMSPLEANGWRIEALAYL